jgi:hypothetical protein
MKPIEQIDFSLLKACLDELLAADLISVQDTQIEAVDKETIVTNYVSIIEKLAAEGKEPLLPVPAINFYNTLFENKPAASTPVKGKEKKVKEAKPPKEKKEKVAKPKKGPKSWETIQADTEAGKDTVGTLYFDSLCVKGDTLGNMIEAYKQKFGPDSKIFTTPSNCTGHIKYRKGFGYKYEEKEVEKDGKKDTFVKMVGYEAPKKA